MCVFILKWISFFENNHCLIVVDTCAYFNSSFLHCRCIINYKLKLCILFRQSVYLTFCIITNLNHLQRFSLCALDECNSCILMCYWYTQCVSHTLIFGISIFYKNGIFFFISSFFYIIIENLFRNIRYHSDIVHLTVTHNTLFPFFLDSVSITPKIISVFIFKKLKVVFL